MEDKIIDIYKETAKRYDVDLLDIKTVIESDAIPEYLATTVRILHGVMKMGIRVYEHSIPAMIGIILSVIRLGPKASIDFAMIMIKEFEEFKKSNHST